MEEVLFRKRLRFVALHVTSFALFVVFACPEGQAQFSVSPIMIDQLKVYPGGTETFTVNIVSSSKQRQLCTVSLSAMEVLGSGLPVQSDDAPRSCRDWITVRPTEFALAPNEGKRLVCRIRPPQGTVGGYYAILACDGVLEGAGEDSRNTEGVGAAIRFRHRILVPVLLTVPGPDMRAVIDAAGPVMTQEKGSSGYTLELPLRNRGNMHARIHGTAEIRSEAAQLVEKFELVSGRGFLLPEHERVFESKGEINLSDGAYVAHLRLDLENTRRPMENAFPFYVQDGVPRVAELTDELRAKLERQSAGFIVKPSYVGLPVRPGARRTEVIDLVNLTTDTLRVLARPAEWYRTPEGQDLVGFEAAPHGHSGGSVLTVQQPAIELPPRGRTRVPIVAEVPRGAVGERYAAICFDRPDLELDPSPEGRARRSTMVRIRAEGTGEAVAEVASFEAKRNAKGAFDLEVRCRNTGDTSFVPEIGFTIRNAVNDVIDKVPVPEQPPFVQAGGEGVLSREWAQVVEPGEYSAEATLRYDPNKPALSARARFTVPAIEAGAPEPAPTAAQE